MNDKEVKMWAFEKALEVAHARGSNNMDVIELLKNARTLVRFVDGPKPRAPKGQGASQPNESAE